MNNTQNEYCSFNFLTKVLDLTVPSVAKSGYRQTLSTRGTMRHTTVWTTCYRYILTALMVFLYLKHSTCTIGNNIPTRHCLFTYLNAIPTKHEWNINSP